MRLWSLHPKYLDSRGLVALWRESLLAKKVLEGRTQGYTRHPQLIRFRQHPGPLPAINSYLEQVYSEASTRGYQFDKSKFTIQAAFVEKILVTQGQLDYEWVHLLKKLNTRAPKLYEKLKQVALPQAHPSFELVSGPVAEWEVVSKR